MECDEVPGSQSSPRILSGSEVLTADPAPDLRHPLVRLYDMLKFQSHALTQMREEDPEMVALKRLIEFLQIK